MEAGRDISSRWRPSAPEDRDKIRARLREGKATVTMDGDEIGSPLPAKTTQSAEVALPIAIGILGNTTPAGGKCGHAVGDSMGVIQSASGSVRLQIAVELKMPMAWTVFASLLETTIQAGV